MATLPSCFCGAAGTSACSGCNSASTPTSYCSKECQKRDWPKHKILCKDVQLHCKLRHAATLIQAVWLSFREQTWDTPITRVEIVGDRLITYDGNQRAKTKVHDKFPNDLMANGSVKAGVLCNMVCNEPFAYLHNFIMLLTQDLPITLHEVSMNLKKPPRINIAVHPDGNHQPNWPTYSHQVLRATSKKTGKAWYFDITGAQYGICAPFWQKEDYDGRFFDKIAGVYPAGTNKTYVKACAEGDALQYVLYGTGWDAAAVLDKDVEQWVKEYKKPLSKVLDEKSVEWETLKLKLLTRVGEALAEFVKKANYGKQLRASRQVDVSQSNAHATYLARQIFEPHHVDAERAAREESEVTLENVIARFRASASIQSI